MGTPRSGEGSAHFHDEIRRCSEGHAPGVDNVPQDLVDGADGHVCQLVKTDGILAAPQVRRSQQDVEGLDGGHYALLKVDDGDNINVKVVVDEDKMQCGEG